MNNKELCVGNWVQRPNIFIIIPQHQFPRVWFVSVCLWKSLCSRKKKKKKSDQSLNQNEVTKIAFALRGFINTTVKEEWNFQLILVSSCDFWFIPTKRTKWVSHRMRWSSQCYDPNIEKLKISAGKHTVINWRWLPWPGEEEMTRYASSRQPFVFQFPLNVQTPLHGS